MTHQHYHELEADSYLQMGRLKGELFGEDLQSELQERREEDDWGYALVRSRRYLDVARRTFPHLIEELQGYAETAEIPFDQLWLLCLEDELDESNYDRCTTVVTNNGTLIGHNEDWHIDARDCVCLLRKRIGDLSTIELFYYSTLGGNAITLNSHGFLHAVNSLWHVDHRIGVSRNMVARWMSETANPERDYGTLARVNRAAGYHHTIVGLNGRVWSLECTARAQQLLRPQLPFVHTNHYLTDVAPYEDEGDYQGTYTRYRSACEKVRPQMTVTEMQQLLRDTGHGEERSIFNERTIASTVFDLAEQAVYVWLARESQKQWVKYPLESLLTVS